jgi:hypothetical protein
MDEQDEIVSKAEFARRIGRAKSMIGRYVKRGLPLRPDGTISLSAGKAWVAANVIPELSGSFSHRERSRKGVSAPRTRGELREILGPDAAARRALLDRLFQNSAVLPGLLMELGISDMAMICLTTDLFQQIVLRLGGDLVDTAYDWDRGDDLPLVKLDYQALAKKFGIVGKEPKWQRMADDLFDRVDKALEKAEFPAL